MVAKGWKRYERIRRKKENAMRREGAKRRWRKRLRTIIWKEK